jgi:ABC-type ATPase with predicted acetyltransferase domain
MLNDSCTLRLAAEVAAGRPDAAEPSGRVVEVAAMFGLGLDPGQPITLVPPTTLTLRPGQVVFITGPSGGGKSTLLRLIREGLAGQADVQRLDFDQLPPPAEVALVDAIDDGVLPLDAALRLLSLAGLNDAFVMLRRPDELSDGQRYRFDLARTMVRAESADPDVWTVVLADEFGATLDRVAAAALARNLRRWVRQSGRVCFVAATTHDDLLEPLAPDVLIEKRLGAGLTVLTPDASGKGAEPDADSD